jgi:hypothetical protein
MVVAGSRDWAQVLVSVRFAKYDPTTMPDATANLSALDKAHDLAIVLENSMAIFSCSGHFAKLAVCATIGVWLLGQAQAGRADVA